MELKAHAKEAADVHIQAAPSQPKEDRRSKKKKRCIIHKYDSTTTTSEDQKIPPKLLGQSERRRECVAKIFMDEAAGAEAQELFYKKHLYEGPRRVHTADNDYTTVAKRSFHRSVPDSDPNEKFHLGGNQHGARKIIDLKELTTEEPFKMGHVYPAQLEHANIMKVIHMTAKAKNIPIEYDHAGGFIKDQEETSYWAAGVTGIEAATEIMKYSITRRDLLRSSVIKKITDDKRPAPAVEEKDKKLATTTCGTDVAADDMVLEPERLTLKKQHRKRRRRRIESSPSRTSIQRGVK